MKKSILTLTTLFISVISFAQIAYHDALQLKQFYGSTDPGTGIVKLKIDKSNKDLFVKIANHYGKIDTTSTGDDLKTQIDTVFGITNPFIAISTQLQEGINWNGEKYTKPKLFQSFASSINGLNVTTQAQAVAAFMIKRAKEELTIAFFDRFKNEVKKNPEISVLFPKTARTLENLLAYRYPEMLPTLRQAFEDDMTALPYHLDDVLELPRYQALLLNFPEIRLFIRSIRLIAEIEAGTLHPIDAIKEFAKIPDLNDEGASIDFKNMANSIKLSAIVSQSLRSNKDSIGWVSASELRLLVDDPIAFKIYLGLIYQQVKNNNITFYPAKNSVIRFDALMEINKNNLFIFQNQLSEFIMLAEKVKVVYKDIKYKTENGQTPTNDDYYKYINTSIDIVEYSFDIAKLFDPEIKSDDYVKIARNGNDLYRNVYRKDYGSAIFNAVNILNSIVDIINNKDHGALEEARKFSATLPASENSLKEALNGKRLGGLIKDWSQNDVNSILTPAYLAVKDSQHKLARVKALAASDLENLTRVIGKISKYGLFIANLATAKTPEDAEKAIEDAVLPVGSSSIKKYSRWNVSVQSYLGAYYTPNTKSLDNKLWNDQFGVIAPIGIAASYGFKKAGSVSVFATLLDIGAIVDYQLKYDSAGTSNTAQVSKEYTITLGQIISPGAYLVYGFFGNLPLSLGFGGQYGPGLGKIDSNGATVVDNPYWRWNAFLAVDIPFFNLFNWGRLPKKKY